MQQQNSTFQSLYSKFVKDSFFLILEGIVSKTRVNNAVALKDEK